MKNFLKNKKLVAFGLGVLGLAATIFLGVDKSDADKIVGGCQGMAEQQASR